jgi:hypothetical protein
MGLLLIVAILLIGAAVILSSPSRRDKAARWDESEQDPSNLEGK